MSFHTYTAECHAANSSQTSGKVGTRLEIHGVLLMMLSVEMLLVLRVIFLFSYLLMMFTFMLHLNHLFW